MNKTVAYHILRVGMGITFLWIGILILKDPGAWVVYLQPWARDIVGDTFVFAMIANAILDIVIGFFLLIDVATWFFSLLAVMHLTVVLVVSGITSVTVRDIGLITAAIALIRGSKPDSYWARWRQTFSGGKLENKERT